MRRASKLPGLLVWLLAGAVAFGIATASRSASFADGVYLPGDHDSFYHARRVLDAIGDPLRMYQYDTRIHAPEGSWITWPWAYDLGLALIARTGLATGAIDEPMAALVFVAPLWVFVNAALVLAIAGQLRLSLPMQAFALACFALSYGTYGVHRFGMLDHHFVELSFVLGTLLCGLRWFASPDSRNAVALGCLLGAAPAFHNGLFVLQVPVLLTAVIASAAGANMAPRPARLFALTLVLSTLVFLLPSEPFRKGMFDYGLQSWFHLYVAACTAAATVFAASARLTPARLALLCVAGSLAALPVLGEMVDGGRFLRAQVGDLATMEEARSVLADLAAGNLRAITVSYSALCWLLPVGIGGLAWMFLREPSRDRGFLLVASLLGALLLLMQWRLQYFGGFALYLPLCCLIDALLARWPQPRRGLVASVAVLVAVAAHVPSVSASLTPPPLGGVIDYAFVRPLMPALAAACRQRPGIVLADHNDGHYITYHTDCRVIANNFILTAQHEAKIAESQRLLAGSAAGLVERAADVDFLLVRRDDNVLDTGAGRCHPRCPENRGLRQELLIDGPPFPAGLRLLGQVEIRNGASAEAVARLFEIRR